MLIFILIALFLLFVAGVVGIVMYRDWYILTWGTGAAAVFLIVLAFIANLNSELMAIKGILVCGSDDDWARYGGREKLIKYFESNPTQFTIYGIAVTFNMLVGLATTIITANFGAIIAVVGLRNGGNSAGLG
jgi:hypothetical protein